MTERIERPYMMEHWFALLDGAVAIDPRGRAGVAEALGYKRSAVSQVLGGSYPARPDKIAQAVLEYYDRTRCPHLGFEISPKQCAEYATRPCPTTSPCEVRHWRACQACSRRPHGGTQ